MSQQFIGYGSDIPPGPYLKKTREECIAIVQPKSGEEVFSNVTACMLDKFTETDKALYASRQYILTLWPAFVGAIVALAPDPAYMVYDNIWWAALFALTCGGLPGLDGSSSPPHHVEAYSEKEGRSMCEAWAYTAERPKLMSKTETMGQHGRGKSYLRLEWISFALGCALWIGFCVYFGEVLRPAIDFSFPDHNVRGAVWYYISCSPAVLGAVFELVQNRVELYEPVTASYEKAEQAPSVDASTSTADSKSPVAYKQIKVGSALSLWPKIATHQWRRSKYRILVKDTSSHWVFLIGRAMTGIGRVTVFALGSVTMGNILFMPPPDDLYLFVLLLFTTAIPRQLWPGFWANGNRGADLVVFVNSIQLIHTESNDKD